MTEKQIYQNLDPGGYVSEVSEANEGGGWGSQFPRSPSENNVNISLNKYLIVEESE